MRRQWTDDGWRRRFAFLPIFLSDGPNKQMIWLEWVWKRPGGLYTEVSLTNPRGGVEWPYCCDQLRGPMWSDGKYQPEFCPAHNPLAKNTDSPPPMGEMGRE